ncbi:hypothetical protein J3F83DRAFT_391403 [Trichoderma novae-zelandiae]
MSTESSSENKATKACRHCRLHKRKCDKKLPACSTCSSKWTICDYDDDTPIEPAEPDTELKWSEPLAIRRFLCGLELTPAGEKQLLWTACQNKGSLDPVPASKTVLGLVKDIFSYGGTTAEQVAAEHFAKVHEWMPIVDEAKTMADLEYISARDSALPSYDSLALLLLCMDLMSHHCRHPDHSSYSTLYQTTKRLFSLVDVSSPPHLLAKLQAGLLLTAYECGHGMALDASSTLATCFGLMRQLDMSAMLNSPTRRPFHDPKRNLCWAAIVFLDRAIAFSCPDGAVTLLIPTRGLLPQDALPYVDKDTHDFVNTETKFQARACSALRIGEAITAVLGDPNSSDCVAAEKLLHDLVRRHAATADNENIYPVCEGMAMALSAVVSLYKKRVKNLGSAADAKLDIDIKFAYSIAFEMCRVEGALIKKRKGSHAHRICFSGLSCLYRAAVDLDEIHPKEATSEEVKQLWKNLEWFSRHWSVADRLLGRLIYNVRERMPRSIYQ